MKISVVMSVLNGAATLDRTIESVLAQTEGDFELIVIDDGSTDSTSAILAGYARRDRRLRVLTQSNAGLTRSLIRGCAEARAPMIARHDCGDTSHPDRFRRQLPLMRDGVVLVACATEFVGPAGEPLYVTEVDPVETHQSLLHAPAESLHGIAHGSAMFRRDAYERAGGYRAQFRLAQDLDLWIRLAKAGRLDSVGAPPLYRCPVETQSLTTFNRERQTQLKGIMAALRDGGPAEQLLEAAATVLPRHAASRRAVARTYYFIGRCLRKRLDPRARAYFFRTIMHDPLHLRAWASLLTRR